MAKNSFFWVYVIQSLLTRRGRFGRIFPGFCYVGCTNNPARRLRQHNGEVIGGGRYTSKHRPWIPLALYGPYQTKSEALRAEYALKHGRRGEGRARWTEGDSKWCRGPGPIHPWVQNPAWQPPEVLAEDLLV